MNTFSVIELDGQKILVETGDGSTMIHLLPTELQERPVTKPVPTESNPSIIKKLIDALKPRHPHLPAHS